MPISKILIYHQTKLTEKLFRLRDYTSGRGVTNMLEVVLDTLSFVAEQDLREGRTSR